MSLGFKRLSLLLDEMNGQPYAPADLPAGGEPRYSLIGVPGGPRTVVDAPSLPDDKPCLLRPITTPVTVYRMLHAFFEFC